MNWQRTRTLLISKGLTGCPSSDWLMDCNTSERISILYIPFLFLMVRRSRPTDAIRERFEHGMSTSWGGCSWSLSSASDRAAFMYMLLDSPCPCLYEMVNRQPTTDGVPALRDLRTLKRAFCRQVGVRIWLQTGLIMKLPIYLCRHLPWAVLRLPCLSKTWTLASVLFILLTALET